MILPNMAMYMDTNGSKINVFIYKINAKSTNSKYININIIKRLYIKSLFNMYDYSLSIIGSPIINSKCIYNGIVKINDGDKIMILYSYNKIKNFISYVKFNNIKERQIEYNFITSLHLSELRLNKECLLLNINSILNKLNQTEIDLCDIDNLNDITKV